MATIEITNQYKYSSKGPVDKKMLVDTYEALLLESTWLSTSNKKTAYNGMLVSVWKDSDTSKNGVYFLYDSTVTTALGNPDVTNADNWHKLSSTVELTGITTRLGVAETTIEGLETQLAELATTVSTIEDQTTTLGTNVATLQTSVETLQANVETLQTNESLQDAVLAGFGTGEGEYATVKTYVDEKIAEIPEFSLPTASVETLGGVKAGTTTNTINVNESGVMSVNAISVSKLVQETDEDTLILDGGSVQAG